jgi:hypothetical protein
MKFKLPNFGLGSLATKAASKYAPAAIKAGEYIDDPRLIALDAARSIGEKVTPYIVDNKKVPVAVRGFANDVFLDKNNRKQEFTEDDLSDAEKAAYVYASRDAYGTQNRKARYGSGGRNPEFKLDYKNYQSSNDKSDLKKLINAGDYSGAYEKSVDLLKDPNYNARYFTGTAKGELNPDNSFTITDTYDHNDRIPEENFKSPRDKDKQFLDAFTSDKVPFSNIREKMKQISQYYGADPRTGEGAKVNINVNQDEDAKSNNPGYAPIATSNPYVKKLKGLGEFFGFDRE